MLLGSVIAHASDEVKIPPIPSAEEVNKAVSALEKNCNTEVQTPVTGEELNACYGAHPFIMEALMLMSDKDFSDATKKETRKKSLTAAIENKEAATLACVNKMIQYAKEKTDEKNQAYVKFRMSEISQVLEDLKSSKR